MKVFSVLVVALMPFTMLSAQSQWKVDRSHTMINFSVPHMVISEVTGQFKEFDAVMSATKEDFTDARITVSIKAKSIDTGTEGRDNHLRSADFFNAAVDSIITFTSSRIEKVGSDTYKIYGMLTMRGVSKEVVLDTQYKGKIKGMRGMVAAFKATGTINRKEWGLAWNRTIESGGLVVGENVTLSIFAEFNEVKS